MNIAPALPFYFLMHRRSYVNSSKGTEVSLNGLRFTMGTLGAPKSPWKCRRSLFRWNGRPCSADPSYNMRNERRNDNPSHDIFTLEGMRDLYDW